MRTSAPRAVGALCVATFFAFACPAFQPTEALACVAGGSSSAQADGGSLRPTGRIPRIIVVGRILSYDDAHGWRIEVESLVKGHLAAHFKLGTGAPSCAGYDEINSVGQYMKFGQRLVLVTAQPWHRGISDSRHQQMRGSYLWFIDGAGRVTHAISGFKRLDAPRFATLREILRAAVMPDAAIAPPNGLAGIGAFFIALAAIFVIGDKRKLRRTISP